MESVIERQHLLTNFVFLDTEAYRSLSFDWNGRQLTKLRMLSKTQNVRLLITDITKREVAAHLEGAVLDACAAVRKHGGIISQIGFGVSLEMFAKPAEAQARAAESFKTYLLDLQAIEVPLAVSLEAVLADYFERRPPFTEKKKHEFPDAFVIASLIAWCEKGKRRTYVVSHDPDMKAACAEQPTLIYVPSLSEVISHASVTQEMQDALVATLKRSLKFHALLEARIVGMKARTTPSNRHFTAHPISATGAVERATIEDVLDVTVFERHLHKFTLEVGVRAELDLELEVEELTEDEGRIFLGGPRGYSMSEAFSAEVEVNFDPSSPSELEILSVHIPDETLEIDARDLARTIF